MIEAYSTNVTASANSAIPFTTIAVEKGDTVDLKGTSSFAINRCGMYEICVNASCIASAIGALSIQLYKDGSPVSYALTEESASDTTSVHSLNFSCYVPVSKNNIVGCCCSSPTIITIVNGPAATYSIVSASIRRVC